ncbi:histidinol-phosphate transaminase [Rhodococcus rhodochrous]|nr:histidinol-phosphate transaminase [Rhodococcus rhodochrous]MCB8913915.1 histidinol-phosphate transaminase [Rhodococcus rhodochrous]
MNGQSSVDESTDVHGSGCPAVTPADEAARVGPRLRSVLAEIPIYQPGRPAPEGKGPSWKLSSNESPYPPLPGVLDAAVAAAGQLNRYPDLTCAELTRALAEHLGVPADHIAFGTGSIGLIQQLVQISAEVGDEIIYAWRSFESYPIVSSISGARSIQVPLTEDEAHDLNAMADAVTERTRLIFLCTPNNPTGRVLRHDDLKRFLDSVPDQVLVVIDEAYVEFVRDRDAANALELYWGRQNVVVLRTFSKAYGLAGLRIGYAIAHTAVAAALRKTAVSFGVSTIAQCAALASLRLEDALFERVETLVAERSRMREALLKQGWNVPDSHANFLWLRLGKNSDAFADACEAAGVMVRLFAGEGVRIGVGEAEGTVAVLRVAKEFVLR